MQDMTTKEIQESDYLLYIYTPFCGTCHVARTMLEKIEDVHEKTIFYEMNASLHPDFMQQYQVESVPCLLIKRGNRVLEKVYAFQSIGNIYGYLYEYCPELFTEKS
jgi:thioredoxin-like negative regulator of GroEL